MQSSQQRQNLGFNGMNNTPRFKTVISARDNNEQPSDLEYQFREVSDRVKVISKNRLSGAHFHCVKEHMAIRAYYPCDLDDLPPLSKDDDDFDGLLGFLKSFRLAIVLFVLPPNEPVFQQQLSDLTLHFHRAQRLVGRLTMERMDKNMPVLLVPDTKTAMDSLISIANAVTTKIKEGKQSYFQTLHEKHLVPKHVPQTHGLPPKLAIPAEYAQSASVRVASALRHFAATMELPENEDVALQTFLGNLENIARADDVAFRGLPFLSRTKNIVQAFFGTKRGNPVDDSCGISAEDVPQSAQQWKSPSRFDARLQQLTPTRALPFSSPAEFPVESATAMKDDFGPGPAPFAGPFAAASPSNKMEFQQGNVFWNQGATSMYDAWGQYGMPSSRTLTQQTPLPHQQHTLMPPGHSQGPVATYQTMSSSHHMPSQSQFQSQPEYFQVEQIMPQRSMGWSNRMASSGGRFVQERGMYQDQGFGWTTGWTPPRYSSPSFTPPPSSFPPSSHGQHATADMDTRSEYHTQTHFQDPRLIEQSGGIARFQRHAYSGRQRNSNSQPQHSGYGSVRTPFSANTMRR